MPMPKNPFLLFLVGACLLGMLPKSTAPAHAQATHQARKSFEFGVLPYLNTRTLIATYQPVGAALEHSLRRPVALTTAPDLESFARRVFAGEFDLALVPPHYGRIAETDFGYAHLLSYSQYNEALLVTAKHEPLASLDDIRGTSVAIIERSSLLGILAARWFAERGLIEGRDFRFTETGNHSNALYQAVSGKARAAVIWRTILQKSPPELQRDTTTFGGVLYAGPSYSVLVNKRIAGPERQAIKDALLQFEKSPQGREFFGGVAHGGFRDPKAEDAALLDRVLPETRRLLGLSR